MTAALSKADVLFLLQTWNIWMNGPDPGNNKPEAFRRWDDNSPNGFNLTFGLVLHLFLRLMTQIGLSFKFSPLAIWAAKASVKYDHLWWEPQSCGLNNAYTYLGIGYLKKNRIDDAIECLKRSWHIYPCPHNTSYGLKLNLYKKLKDNQKAKIETAEYLDMWNRFKRA